MISAKLLKNNLNHKNIESDYIKNEQSWGYYE